MATIEDSRSDEGAERPGTPTPEPASDTTSELAATGGGDLEFDEAWAGAATDASVLHQPRDPDPAFEDPNDR